MKRFILACSLCVALVCVIGMAAQTSELLKPAYSKGKWGFADARGVLVIPARFDAALPFKDGLAKVGLVDEELPKIDSKPNIQWGYIDESGTVVVDLRYFAIKEFHEDLAAVAVIDKDKTPYHVYGRSSDYPNVKWGYVDRAGKGAILPAFSEAGDFSEGLASVNLIVKSDFHCEIPRNYGYIDRTGALVIQPHFASAGQFHNGRAAVWIGSVEYLGRCLCCNPQFKGKSGYIDTKSNFTEDPKSPASFLTRPQEQDSNK
jgi:hypothetical protein